MAFMAYIVMAFMAYIVRAFMAYIVMAFMAYIVMACVTPRYPCMRVRVCTCTHMRPFIVCMHVCTK